MWRLTIRNLWAHKARLTLTGLAVVLGVAFMAGTMVLTDTMGRTFDGMFAASNAGVDVVVQRPETVDARWGEVRERVPDTVVDEVRRVDGVASAAGTVQGFAQLVDADGTVGSLDGLGATVGMSWIDDDRLNPLRLSSGHAPGADDEVVVDQATAEAQGWAPGDPVTVLAKGRPVELRLAGTATYGPVAGLPGASLVAASDTAAQQLFAEPGAYDAIAVSAADGVDPAELAGRIDDATGAGTYEVVTGEVDTATKQARFRDDLSFFNTFLMAFALVALFVGTFIIYNTFSILIAQRTRDMAMLRAIGAGRAQLLRSLVAESAVVGIVAGAVGLVAGVAVSFGLRALLGAVGLDIPAGPTVVSARTVVVSFAVGVAVTVVSAVAPAIRGSRVRPIAALRDVAIDRSAVSPRRTIAGLAVTATGVAAFAAGVRGGGSGALQLLAVGALATFIGLFVLGPVIARPVVRAMGVPAARLSGLTGRLAGQNAARSPKRTAATSSALMVGVALVGFITILAASTKASVADGVDRSFRADYVVDSGAVGSGGFDPGLAAQLRALDEVDVVAPVRSTPVSAFGGSTTLQATSTGAIDALDDLGTTAGSVADVGPGEVAVKGSTAADHGIAVGDPVTVDFPRTGPVDLRVAAIVDHEINGSGDASYLVDLSTFEANVTDQYDERIFVGTTDGASAASSRQALEEAVSTYPNADLQDQAEFKESITSEIDRILNLIYGLLALALLIALIGIANTLALSIHERRREIGLLRAVGMTRGQVRTAVRWESLLIAMLGTALGCAVAVAGAWGIVSALADQHVTRFVLPVTSLAVIVSLAGVAGVLAALGPAHRAARLPVLDAIGE